MRYEFKLPDLAEGMIECELVGWLVGAGDELKPEQPVAEVMTDKATVVIPSPVPGKVLELPHAAGDIVKVGSTLFVLDAEGEAPAQKKSGGHDAPGAAGASNHRAGGDGEEEPSAAAADAGGATPSAPASSSSAATPAPEADAARPAPTPRGPTQALATPATRRLARELGVDIGQVEGRGPGGRVTPEDVQRHAGRAITRPTSGNGDNTAGEAAPAAAPQGVEAGPPTRVPLGDKRATASTQPLFRPRDAHAGDAEERQKIRGLRKAIYETMARSKSKAAHFTYVEEVDCENLFAAREKLAPVADRKLIKLTYLAFIAKATTLAIASFPKMNARVDDQAMEVVYKKAVHLGIAAATDPGLVVPVIRHADRMSLLELAWHIQGLGERAKSNTLKPEELKGSTITITSLGKLGGLLATPIINHPEVAILGVHQMQKRAVVLDDDTIVARRRMNLSLAFDHRLIDGHEGAAFAQAIKAYLEDPELMMLEMA